MITFEGKCNGRRLRVSIDDREAKVEALSGHQSGSIFHFALNELKAKPDLVIDSATKLSSLGLIVAIMAGFIGIMSALHWGEGVTKQAVVICVALVVAAIVTMKVSPKRRIFVWNTKTGAQAFAFEETKKNATALGEFMTLLESLALKSV